MARHDLVLSYHNSDEPVAERLADRLRAADLQPYLGKLPPVAGETWKKAIEKALAQSSIWVILLGSESPDLWQNDEFRAAVSKQLVRGPDFRPILVRLPRQEPEQQPHGASTLARELAEDSAGQLIWVDLGSDPDEESFSRLIDEIARAAKRLKKRRLASAVGGLAGLAGLISALLGIWILPKTGPPPDAVDPDSLNAVARLQGRLGDIRFAEGSAEIPPDQEELLARYAEFITDREDLQLAVDGHADPGGEYIVATALAERRAQAIADQLRELGVPEESFRAYNFAERRPVCLERTSECRQANARVELTVFRPEDEQRYRWQSWSEEAGSNQEVGSLTVDRGYSVFFDLSALDYRKVLQLLGRESPVFVQDSSDVLGQRIRDAIAALELGEESKIPILVQPILVGEGLRYAADVPGAGQAQTIVIDVARLSRQYLPAAHADSARDLARLASALREEDGSWTPVRVPVVATSEGCGGVALSIWSSSPPRPLDQIFHPVTVGDATCRNPEPGMKDLSQRLLAVYGSSQDLANAALHVFEMGLGEEPYVVGVFHDSSSEDEKFHSWELAGSISDYISRSVGLANDVKRARRGKPSYDFSVVSDSLKRKLFSGKDDSDIEAAADAESAFERFAAGEAPRFFARLVKRNGESVFLPLGLLEFGQEVPFRARARIVQPLFEDDFWPKPCIASWTSAVPESEDDLDKSEQTELEPVGDLFPNRFSQWSAVQKHLLTYEKSPAPEGLLILAHHAEGAFWFHKESLGVIDYREVKRSFQPGSVAVLAACSVGKLDHLKMAERLQDRGIDAMILAPVDVTLPMAARFAMHFSNQVAKAVDRRAPSSFQELFAETLKSLQSDSVIEDADAAYEFLLAGDGEIRLCAAGREGS